MALLEIVFTPLLFRKEAGLFCRTSSSVRLWLELKQPNGPSSQFENNYFTEMCSGSQAGSYVRLTDFAYHSTLGLRVIKKKKKKGPKAPTRLKSECLFEEVLVRC